MIKFTSVLTVAIWTAVLVWFGSALLAGQLRQQSGDLLFQLTAVLVACCAIVLAWLASARRSLGASRWLVGISALAALWAGLCAWVIVSRKPMTCRSRASPPPWLADLPHGVVQSRADASGRRDALGKHGVGLGVRHRTSRRSAVGACARRYLDKSPVLDLNLKQDQSLEIYFSIVKWL